MKNIFAQSDSSNLKKYSKKYMSLYLFYVDILKVLAAGKSEKNFQFQTVCLRNSCITLLTILSAMTIGLMTIIIGLEDNNVP